LIEIKEDITSIGAYAFAGLNNVASVSMANSIKGIGEYAFASCAALPSISLGNQLKTIGAYAFYQCTSLKSVSLPSNITTLNQGTFLGCTSLGVIGLGSVTSIGSYALSETGLTYPRIPESVEIIGEYAFSDCKSLKEVTFYGQAPQIADTAFWEDTIICLLPAYDSSWEKLVQQNFGGDLTWIIGYGTCGDRAEWILSLDGVLTISGTGKIYDYDGRDTPWKSLIEHIRQVVVCDGITAIGNYAFAACEKLHTVTMADSVTQIGSGSWSYLLKTGGCRRIWLCGII
jgi:hypothetical protein